MNLGALLNLVLVRHVLRAVVNRSCQRRLDRLNVKVVEMLLVDAPVRTVVLLRLPLLTGGILNYMFSLSQSLSVWDMVVRADTGGQLVADRACSRTQRSPANPGFPLHSTALLCLVVPTTVYYCIYLSA